MIQQLNPCYFFLINFLFVAGFWHNFDTIWGYIKIDNMQNFIAKYAIFKKYVGMNCKRNRRKYETTLRAQGWTIINPYRY